MNYKLSFYSFKGNKFSPYKKMYIHRSPLSFIPLENGTLSRAIFYEVLGIEELLKE